MLYRSGLQHMVWFCLTVTIISSAISQPVLAATHEQIIESCREALRPQIMACAQAKGLRGNPEAVRQQCGMGMVRACVIREEQKQASGTPAPAAPKNDTEIVPAGTSPVQPVFVAPPRTISDITAVLDSEKPDPAKIAQRKAEADAEPPANAAPSKLAQFYYDRGNARALLAQNKEALADGLQALTISKAGVDFLQSVRIRQFVGLQYSAIGDPKDAIAHADETVRFAEQNQRRGAMINALGSIARTYVSMGDVNQASTYAGRVQALVQEARGSPSPKWRAAYPIYGHSWEADADETHGIVLEARGQYAEAEAAFRRAETFRRASLKDISKFDFPPPPEQVLQAANTDLSLIARNESKQGRLSEAEADARRALLEMLNTRGKYSPATPHFIVELAGILVEQGRYPEAEKLVRSALDVQRTLGIADDAPTSVSILSHLGNILVLQSKTKDAATIYAELSKAIAQWPAQQREAFEINGSRIVALYEAGQIDQGIAAAEEYVKRQTARTGPNSYDTASARGTLALGYARAGRDADAIREFKAAIPVLMTGARENSDEDDPTLVAARDARLQRIVEAYIGELAHGTSPSNNAAAETFSLADAVRGRAVQQSLADSNARAIAKDPALAELVRKDQDLTRQIGAELGTLNNLLALPSDQRGDQSVPAINAEIGKLRADRKATQDEIKRRFPAYANLVDPKPPTVEEIKATLRPGEAMLSFYFGRYASFVWAVPKDGAVAFAAVPATQAQIADKIHKLRESLEPQGAMVSDIAPFDLTLAYDLYASLLQPVEAGWKSEKSLIVVTNGALGELPISLLPTAPSQVDPKAGRPFSGYRNVPWLARTHAVTISPSASALVTLRRLPPGSPNRDKLIGFGDPYFNAQEEAEADSEQSAPPPQLVSASADDGATQMAMRGIPLKLRSSPRVEDIDKAELTMLPRLPDTREELTAMAHALDVDPAKALYLGKAANEQNVETLDLSHYRIVAFATHGLVPGDIDGLTQPALALTEPEIAGIKGDGLLTMEEILGLKLDADWVVLSACNTAAGAGAGAEAASGLGSAFFYAGSRALLVTNWSVQSTSARELTSDLFRRQVADPALSRGEALRQAMMALIDGPGEIDASGQTVYTYAHPLFWAPYSVIGDGGGS
jgi:CHAT domain-containing protein/tetratricopeptide (TPR) repeat protein